MSKIKIGLFSLDDHTGCTSLSIHIANYIACGSSSVALVEAKENQDPFFSKAQTSFENDGTFYLNKVHFYPQNSEIEPQEDIIIYDYGKIGILHEFDKDFTRLYLCTAPGEDKISDIQDYLLDTQTECEIILSGPSKEQLQNFKAYGFRCIPVDDKKEAVCPYNLALQIGLLLRANGIIPPEYHKDYTFQKLELKREEPEEKHGFFGFGKKKKAQPEKRNSDINISNLESSIHDQEEKDLSQKEVVTVVGEKPVSRKANTVESMTFVDVPAPIAEIKADTSSTKSKKESIAQKIAKKREASRTAAEEKKAQKEIAKLKYEKTHDKITDCLLPDVFHKDIMDKKDFCLIWFFISDYNRVRVQLSEDKANALRITCAKALKRHFDNAGVYMISPSEFAIILDNPSKNARDRIELELSKLDEFMAKKTASQKEVLFQLSYGCTFSSENDTTDDSIRAAKEMQSANEEQRIIIQQKKIEEEKKRTEEKEQLAARQAAEEQRKKEEAERKREEERLAKKTEKEHKTEKVEKKQEKRILKLFEPSERQKTVYMGHITVLVTALRHSCGCSYTAGSIASAMTDIYNRNVHLRRNSEDALLPDNYMVKDIKTDNDMVDAIRSGLIVLDEGLYSEFDDKKREEQLRADLKIMVSTTEEQALKKLAEFIHEQGNTAYDWLYVFNHVPEQKEKEIAEIMNGYTILILPQHDSAEVPVKLRKEWKDAIEWQVNSFQ